MSSFEELNSEDFFYLRNHFNLTKIDFFKDSILKKKIGNAYFFLFPFKGENDEIGNVSYFNIGYQKKTGSGNCEYWIKTNTLNQGIDFIFLSDNPLSLIKYYSQNFSKYENKRIVFIVPFQYNYNSILKIRQEYDSKKVLTVFENQTTSDLFRILTNAAMVEKKLTIENNTDGYLVTLENRTHLFPELNYRIINEKFRMYSNVEHKKMKNI